MFPYACRCPTPNSARPSAGAVMTTSWTCFLMPAGVLLLIVLGHQQAQWWPQAGHVSFVSLDNNNFPRLDHMTSFPWWRHQMETFSALLAKCFDVFFDLCLNKRLRKQSWGWWFQTLSLILWCHWNANGWHFPTTSHNTLGVNSLWPSDATDTLAINH